MLLLLSPVLACGDVADAALYPSSQATLPVGAVVLIGHPEPEYEVLGSQETVEELDLGRWTGLVMELPDGDYYVAFQGVDRLISLDSTVSPGDFSGAVRLVDATARLEDFDDEGCDVASIWLDTTLSLDPVDGFGWSALVRDTVSGQSFGYVEMAPFIAVERDLQLVLPAGEEEQACLRVTVYDPFLTEKADFDLDCVDLPVVASEGRCATGPAGAEWVLALAALSAVAVRRGR